MMLPGAPIPVAPVAVAQPVWISRRRHAAARPVRGRDPIEDELRRPGVVQVPRLVERGGEELVPPEAPVIAHLQHRRRRELDLEARVPLVVVRRLQVAVDGAELERLRDVACAADPGAVMERVAARGCVVDEPEGEIAVEVDWRDLRRKRVLDRHPPARHGDLDLPQKRVVAEHGVHEGGRGPVVVGPNSPASLGAPRVARAFGPAVRRADGPKGPCHMCNARELGVGVDKRTGPL